MFIPAKYPANTPAFYYGSAKDCPEAYFTFGYMRYIYRDTLFILLKIFNLIKNVKNVVLFV